MFKNRCKLEGERYAGEFTGTRNSKKVIKRDYTGNYGSTYSYWQGTGAIFDKENEENYVFGFSTNGTCYFQPRELEKLVMNFRGNVDKEVKEEDYPKLVDYVLGSLVSEVQNFNSTLPEIILMPHQKGELVRAGLIPDEEGQLYLRF